MLPRLVYYNSSNTESTIFIVQFHLTPHCTFTFVPYQYIHFAKAFGTTLGLLFFFNIELINYIGIILNVAAMGIIMQSILVTLKA